MYVSIPLLKGSVGSPTGLAAKYPGMGSITVGNPGWSFLMSSLSLNLIYF